MKTASAALIALLASREFYLVDLYQFTLVGGTVLRYAAATQDVYELSDLTANSDVTLLSDVVNFGTLYSAGGVEAGPYFERTGDKSKIALRAGLQVDTLKFTVYPGTAQVSGTAFKRAVVVGVFDGAEVQLKRAVMPKYGDTSPGVITLFAGRVGQISGARGEGIQFSVNSHLELLDQNLPRNLYQSGCIWTLFDAGCALSASSFAVNGSVAAGSTALIINAALAQGSGYYDLGKIKFTSGVNNGITVGIRKYIHGTPGTLTLLQPLPNAPGTGDTFTAYPGCDKQQSTCSGKFSNLVNFRGFPYIPTPETAT